MYVHLVDPYSKVPPFVRGICWNFVKIFDLEIPEHLGGDYIVMRCDFHLLLYDPIWCNPGGWWLRPCRLAFFGMLLP